MKGLLGLTICGLLIAGCTSVPKKDDVIARVNGQPIFVQDYQTFLETLKPRDLTLSGREKSELKNLVVKNLIRRAVILSEAREKRIVLSEAELEAGIQSFKQGHTQSSFEQSLLDEMVDEAEWKNSIKQNLLIDKLFERTEKTVPRPSLDEARTYYEAHHELYHENARASAFHLVVSDRKLAEEIHKKLRARPQDFVALAAAHSIGPEAKEGAKIDVDENTLPEALDHALFKGKIGSLSPIIETPYGFHIVRPIQRKPELNKDFDQVSAQIIRQLADDKRKAWILRYEEQLLKSATIEYNRKLIAQL